MPLSLNGSGGITYPDGTVNATRSVSTAGDNISGTLTVNRLTVGSAATPDGFLDIKNSSSIAGWSIKATNSLGYGSGIWQRPTGQHELVLRDTANAYYHLTNNGSSLELNNNGTTAAVFNNNNTLVLGGGTTSNAALTKLYAYSAGQDDNHGIIQAESASTSASIVARTPVGTTQMFQWVTYGARIGSRAMSGANAGFLMLTAGNDVIGAALSPSRQFQVGNIVPGVSAAAAMTVYGESGGDIVQFHCSRNGSTPYFFVNTSQQYGIFSDSRLKENIEIISEESALNFIRGLEPVEYDWKSEALPDAEQVRQSGFIAQNVLKSAQSMAQKNSVPGWKTFDENDPECPFLSLSDHNMTAPIVRALQAALDKIDELVAKNAELEVRVSALESK